MRILDLFGTSFVSGVNRQALSMRPPPGISDASNVDFSHQAGATTRSGFKHIKKLLASPVSNYRTFFFDHGNGETYFVLANSSEMKVFNTAGNAVFLHNAVGNFNYLSTATDPRDLRLANAGDYVFVTNGNVAPAMSSSPTAGYPGGLQMYAFLFVRQCNYKKDYSVTITMAAGTTTFTVKTWDGVTKVAPEVPDPANAALGTIKTNDIAAALAAAINGAVIGGHNMTASAVGSVIKITCPTIAPTDFTTNDSEGNKSLLAMLTNVERVSDLPLVCEDGAKFKIVGEDQTAENDYWVKFVANKTGGFGSGHWAETNGYNITYQADASTWPHALVRKVDDGAGTVTGTPFAIYFDYLRPAWNSRDAGDTVSNPNPTFIGTPINEIFYFQNRLGFLSGENIILSEADSPFNYFLTSVRDVVPTDKIDIRYSGPLSIRFHSAVPHESVLVLFSKYSIFALASAAGGLSAASVELTAVGAYETDDTIKTRAVVNGRSFFVQQTKEGFAGVLEGIAASSAALLARFEVQDATLTVHNWLVGRIQELVASGADDVIYAVTTNMGSRIYVNRFLWRSAAEKAYASWTHYDLTEGSFAGLGMSASTLYALVNHGDGLYLEATDASADRPDLALGVSGGEADASYKVCLDRWVDGSSGIMSSVYDPVNNLTTFTFPYPREVGTRLCAYPVGTDSIVEVSQSAEGVSPGTITVMGNEPPQQCRFGILYDSWFKIERPCHRIQSPNTPQTAAFDPPAQVLYGVLQHHYSGPLKAEVTFTDGRVFSSVLEAPVNNPSAVFSRVAMLTGGFRFGVLGRDDTVSIKVSTTSPLPMRAQGITWTHRTSALSRARS